MSPLNLLFAVCALGLLLGAPTRAGQEQDRACVQFLTGVNSSSGGLQARLHNVTQDLYDLDKQDKAARDAESQAQKLSSVMQKGLDKNQQFQGAKAAATSGAEKLHRQYCDQCQRIKLSLDRMEKELASTCDQAKVAKVQGEIERLRGRYGEKCKEREPYKQLCK